MTNNNNDNIVEEVELENKIANNDYYDESVVVIEYGADTGKRSENINNEVTEKRVSNVVEISDDSNGERITTNNGVSLKAKHVAVDKVSNNVNYDNFNKVVEIEVSKCDTCLLYTSRCV